MNQILVVGNKSGKSSNSTIDLKKIILFFSVAIIVFGVILVINGAVGLNKNKSNNSKNPVGIVDTTPTPISPEEDDEEAPTIELAVVGENVKVIARDETHIEHIEYRWNEEETQTVKADEDDKNKIETLIQIKQGTNTLKVVALDKAGNTHEVTQEFQGKIRPTVELHINVEGNGVIVSAYCEDGIKKVEFTVNGDWTRIPIDEHNSTKEEWASAGVIVEYSNDGKIIRAQYTAPLREGENIINAYAYSLEGLVGEKDGKATYTPSEQ